MTSKSSLFLKSAREKLDDENFWQHQADGLAYFSDRQSQQFFLLETDVDPIAHVGDEYLLSPVVSSVIDYCTCYVLACSPKRVRLLKIDGDRIEDLQPDSLPKNLREALNIDEYVSTLQFHSTSKKGNADRSDAIHHGQGGSDPDVRKQDEILQFFHRLNDALDEFFGVEDAPLIFAGVEYLFPVFREASDYRNLYEDVIAGNPDDWSPEEILEKAKPILQSMVDSRAKESLDEFNEKAHTDWASDRLEDIAKAAKLGQLQTLLVHHDSAPQPLNDAIVNTLRYGGQIVFLPETCESVFRIGGIFRTPAGTFLNEVQV